MTASIAAADVQVLEWHVAAVALTRTDERTNERTHSLTHADAEYN